MGSALKGTKVDKRTTIKHVPIPSLVQALMEMLLSGTDSGVAAVRIQTGIDQWKGTPIHPTLNAMWLSANNDVLAFRESVSGWFDAEMDRLSGLYKRLLRWVLVSFSAIVALVVNLNPLALAGDLWHDAALRTQFVNAAESTVDNTPATKDSYQELLAACKKETKAPENPEDIAKAVVKAENCATGALDQAKNLGLTTHALWSGHWADGWSVRDGVSKALGLIILTGALSMGGPFWFDILKRLMGIRGALHRRET